MNYERFVAMFVCRSHCKRELFTEVQMPFLTKKEFWKDLAAGFKDLVVCYIYIYICLLIYIYIYIYIYMYRFVYFVVC